MFEISEAIGKWPGIFDHLGIKASGPRMRHIECPVCGKNSFRMDDKTGNGEWICTCGNGNGWELIIRVFNIDFNDAVKLVSQITGECKVSDRPPPRKGASREDLKKLFIGASRLNGKCPASRYLDGRGLIVSESMPIWYQPKCYNGDTKEEREAILYAVARPDGTPVAVQRYWFSSDDIEKKYRKKSTATAEGETVGASIRLFALNDDSTILHLAEGPGTAMAVAELTGEPCWATITANGMISWEPPKGIPLKKIVVWADNDKSFTGQAAAWSLARRLRMGKKYDFEVREPMVSPRGDWLDYLKNAKRRDLLSDQVLMIKGFVGGEGWE